MRVIQAAYELHTIWPSSQLVLTNRLFSLLNTANMKYTAILAVASVGSAFVLPDEQVNNLQHVEKESRHSVQQIFDSLPSKSEVFHVIDDSFNSALEGVEETYNHINEDVSSKYDLYTSQSKETWSSALAYAQEAQAEVTHKTLDTFDDARDWIESTKEAIHEAEDYSTLGHHDHHGHHDHKPNMTVYQLISESKYTTKLAKLINKYDDLVEALNGTSANFTVFAPTDYAFEKVSSLTASEGDRCANASMSDP